MASSEWQENSGQWPVKPDGVASGERIVASEAEGSELTLHASRLDPVQSEALQSTQQRLGADEPHGRWHLT